MKAIKSSIIFLILLLPLVGTLAGCSSMGATTLATGMRAEVIPPPGFLYTSVKAPLIIDIDNTQSNHPSMRLSQSKTQYFEIPFVTPFVSPGAAWGDASIKKIANDGGIEEVAYADYEFFSLLGGIYKSFTINVYGYEFKR